MSTRREFITLGGTAAARPLGSWVQLRLGPREDDVFIQVMANALRIKPPRTSALTAGFCERLPGHLSVRREGHFEFNATECGSGEGLAVEECRLDVAWSHGLRSEGSARVEKYCRNDEWFCAHRISEGWPAIKHPVRLTYKQSAGILNDAFTRVTARHSPGSRPQPTDLPHDMRRRLISS